MIINIQSLYDLLLGVGLGMARLLPCMILVPTFCFKYLKGPLRYAFVAVMALIPAPAIGRAIGTQEDLIVLAALLIKESILGTLLGVLLYAPFWMFASVGALLDSQRGALSGGQLNPALGPDATPLGELFQETLILLVILSGGLSLINQVIWDSYLIWPPTAWTPELTADGLGILLGHLSLTVRHMLLYAAPFIGILLLIEAAFAIVSLYAQQLNVSILAMPAKSLAGIAFLVIYLPTLLELAGGEIASFKDLKILAGQLLKAP